MWKAPQRPSNKITQTYNSGIVTVYSVSDAAEPGYQPVKRLSRRATLRYEERRVGINRFYSGKENQAEIERVLRVPQGVKISSQDVAITEDGHQYSIEQIQTADVYPPSLDLTLKHIAQNYDLCGG